MACHFNIPLVVVVLLVETVVISQICLYKITLSKFIFLYFLIDRKDMKCEWKCCVYFLIRIASDPKRNTMPLII